MPAWVRYLARLLADQPLEPGTPVLLDLPGPRGVGAGDYFLQCRFAAPLSHWSVILLRQELGPAD